jgi:hypothetical protein
MPLSYADLLVSDYFKLVSNLESKNPGRGYDFIGKGKKDRPMAYALLLSAFAHQYRITKDSSARLKMRYIGQWLLNNHDINKNGISDYGLADEWDQFSDGSINLAHTEYTITTAYSLRGLLDWYEVDRNSPHRAILSTINSCLKPFLSGRFNSPTGIYSYSLSPADIAYDVFNQAMSLAGFMQRYSRINELNEKERTKLVGESHRVMMIALNHRRIDIEGNWFWKYGLQKNIKRSNDLGHAICIMDGIREYVNNSGLECNKFDWNKVKNHIYSFYRNERWQMYPSKYANPLNPLLWDLGMLLKFLSLEEFGEDYLKTLTRQIEEYRIDNSNSGCFECLLGSKRRYIRCYAYLLLGMSFHFFK